MRSPRLYLRLGLGLLIAIHARAQQADIGTPPKLAEQTVRESASKRLASQAPFAPSSWIDTSTRAAVQASYFTTFLPTKSVAMGWTGDLSIGSSGVTSQAYKDAALARVNWVRALAGVPPVSALNPTYSQDDQDAAMMMSVNGQLNHSPPTTWKFYSATGALAAQNSNLCLGFPASDPGCIEQYMYDSGSNNTEVGHRRWILYPQTANMGTGDIPAQPGYSSANALWVIDSPSYSNSRPATRDGFVGWPAKGYFPYELLPVRWTFSYPGADFGAATVATTRNGSSVPVALQPIAQGYGENTIAWVPDNQDPAAFIAPTPPSSDTTTSVTIGNVLVNGTAQSFTYNVTIFDPNTYPPGTTFNFNPPSALFGANGGTGTTALAASPANILWGAASNADWLTVTAGSSGTGNGNITYLVAQNTSSHNRTGQISVGSSAFFVTQTGLTCTFSVNPGSFSFGPQARGGTISYTAFPSDCVVRASWDVNWINASFSSAGLDFTLQANAGATRTGHIEIGTQVVTITQTGMQTTGPAQLNIAKSHSGSFTQSQMAATYAVTVTNNSSAGPTSGTVTVTETVPSGLTLVSLSGTGWSCSVNTCSRSDALNAGSRYPVITVTVNVAANATSPQVNAVSVSGGGSATASTTDSTIITGRTPPFGHIDTPVNGATGQTGAINFTGWALSFSTVTQVALCREPVTGEAAVTDPHCLLSSSPTGLVYLGNAVLVPGVRPDVALSYPGYPNNNWGWGAQILTNYLPGTNGLPLGNGSYKLHAIAADAAGLTTDLGTTSLSANNAASVLPFGTIDTPGQGATISGTSYINFGWVVTPQPNMVPIDGSTVTVHIDGVAVGHPTYNQFRSDIATLFPGLKNSSGAVGFFVIDTTKLSNGIHNIDWVVTDSAGHSGGIGSRNFFVQN